MIIETIRSGDSPSAADVRARRAERTLRARLSALLLIFVLATAPTAAFAEGAAKETGREGGLGAAAALSTLVYGPVKLLYATGGLIVGSFAWAFTAGDTQVAEKVFTRSLRGTYVITPDHLTGERELVFIGRDVASAPSTARPEAVASARAAQAEVEVLDESGYDEMGW